MVKRVVWCTVLGLAAAGFSAKAEVHSGRNMEDRKDFSIGISAGSAFDLDAEVNETTRPLDEFRGQRSPPENYSWEDLGIDQEFNTLGFFLEKMWRYATLQLQVSYGNPQGNGIANRDYYIGVDDVSFEGQDYEYMKIPKGTKFSGDIDVYNIELGVNITPVSFESDEYYLTFTPWIRLGVFAFITDYSIDAGPAQGITQYENPPRDYVVGGDATGMNGIAIPEIGIGGELRFAVTDATHLSIEAGVNYLKFDGDTGDFGVSSRNEKNVEIDFISLNTRITLEIVLSDTTDLLIGIEAQTLDADAKVEAKDKSREEIEEIREKFDKDVTFTMNHISAFIGLRF